MNLFEQESSLKKMNAVLVQLIPQYSLLGDIPLSKEEYLQLANRIGVFYDHGANTQIFALYKESLAVFLVFCAVYEYDDGTFWAPIEKHIGEVVQVHRKKMFCIFSDVLVKYSLPRFEEQSKEGFAYVTPILCHAGIPVNAFDSYFSAISNTLNDSYYDEFSLDDYLLYLKNKTEVTVRRYLSLKERKVAYKFIQDTRVVINGQEIEKEAMNLTGNYLRMLSQEEIWHDKPVIRKNLRARNNVRISAPRIKIDVDGIGIYCYFPSIILKTCSDGFVEWKIEYDNYEATTKSALYTKGQQFVSQEKEMILKPAQQYVISLKLGDQVISRWEFEGVRQFYMAFYKNGNMLRERILPQKEMILLLDKKERIKNGHLLPIAEIPGIPFWENYKLYEIDLTKADFIDCDTARIKVAEELKPTLEGGRLIDNQIDSKLYYVLPNLRLPNIRNSEWHIEMNKMFQQKADEKEKKLLACNGQIINIMELMNEESYGKYQLKVYQYFGSSYRFEFEYVPRVTCIENEVYWPTQFEGYASCNYCLRIKKGTNMIPYNGDMIRQNNDGQYSNCYLKIKKTESSFIGDYIYSDGVNQFTTTIKQILHPISWRISGIDNLKAIDYKNKVYGITPNELRQSTDPTIYFAFHFSEHDEATILVFSVLDRNKIRIRQTNFDIVNKEGLRIPVNDYLLEMKESSQYYLYVELKNQFEKPIVAFAVAKIQSELSIEACHCHSVGQNVLINWNEENLALDRECLMFNLLAPWSLPISIPIEENSCEVSIDSTKLAAGIYRYTIQKVKDELFAGEAIDELCATVHFEPGAFRGKGEKPKYTPLQRILARILETRLTKSKEIVGCMNQIKTELDSLNDVAVEDVLPVSYTYIANHRFFAKRQDYREVKNLFKSIFLKFWRIREQVMHSLLVSNLPDKYINRLLRQFQCYSLCDFSFLNSEEKSKLIQIDEHFEGFISLILGQQRGLSWLGVSEINELRDDDLFGEGTDEPYLSDRNFGDPNYINDYFKFVYEDMQKPKNIGKTTDVFLKEFQENVVIDETILFGKTRFNSVIHWRDSQVPLQEIKKYFVEILEVPCGMDIRKEYRQAFTLIAKRKTADEIGYYIGLIALYMTLIRHGLMHENKRVSMLVTKAIEVAEELYYRDAALFELYFQEKEEFTWD